MTDTENAETQAHAFYREMLTQLHATGEPFLVGGGFAFCSYTGIKRDTKDLDIFCKAGQCPHLLQAFQRLGYQTEQTDIRWLAKVFKGNRFMDIIFDSPNNICQVDDTWYEHSKPAEFMGIEVRLIPVEELIWCKTYVQNRERFDGADINHLLLRQGKNIDWDRLLARLDRHWHLLLAELLVFQFVYPSEFRDIIPRELVDRLIERFGQQYEIPGSIEKICRGPLIDQTQYAADILEWRYKVTTMKSV